MKLRRVKAAVILSAIAVTGSAGMAVANDSAPAKPAGISEKDKAGVAKDWASVEKSLANLTDKQKAELENATAETVASDVTEKDKAAIEKGWAEVEEAFSKISKDLIAKHDKLLGKS